MEIIYWILGILFVCYLGYVGINYLEGKYTISSVKVVDSNTYIVTGRNWDGNEYNDGRATRIVQKITYQNGRVKYKTIEIKH